MNILAFDTCLGAISVGIGKVLADGRYCVNECFEERSTGHAEAIVPMIRQEMARASLSFRDMARLAVTLGPGTFTGVRTGISVARALRLATGLPVAGVSSLALIAHRILADDDGETAAVPVMIALDARRGRIYAQVFASNALNAVTPPAELTPEQAAELAIRHGARVAGSGASSVAAASEAARRLVVAAPAFEPHAADLVWLAAQLDPLDDVRPIYIRPPDAKPQAGKRIARVP